MVTLIIAKQEEHSNDNNHNSNSNNNNNGNKDYGQDTGRVRERWAHVAQEQVAGPSNICLKWSERSGQQRRANGTSLTSRASPESAHIRGSL